jgi:RNA polymerase sigma-70 factor, ECF subfamily
VSAEPDGNDAPRALLALYDDALPVVYGYFVRRCSDRGTAEDLASETFLAAMDAARKDTPPPMTVPWLLGVARHKLADHYRRRHDRFSVPVAELPEPVDPADNWDAELDRIVAESVLAKLPEQHRTVLALRYMDDCSVPECAELIGRTVHATRRCWCGRGAHSNSTTRNRKEGCHEQQPRSTDRAAWRRASGCARSGIRGPAARSPGIGCEFLWGPA